MWRTRCIGEIHYGRREKETLTIMDKRNFHIWVHEKINANAIKVVILFVPILIRLVTIIKAGKFVIDDMLDITIIVSFIFVFLCEAIADIIYKIFDGSTEDATKLTVDYNNIVKKYCVEKKRMAKKDDVVYPVIIDYQRKLGENLKYNIIKSENKYVLPKQIADNAQKIMHAHNKSVIYNNITIRLDDLEVGDEIKMRYSYTTYYDTLLTNRAMDYPFQKERTIREIYEPGPFLHSLKETKMSNHIGFNGFIKLKEGKFIFVQRSSKVSTAKKKWSPSISASLKAAYAVNDKHSLTMEGIINAICGEIRDELKIPISSQDIGENPIIGFYRDLIEGGKPHFVFYYESNLSIKEFEQNFREKLEQKNSKKDKRAAVIVDGIHFRYVTLDDLKNASYEMDKIVIEGNDYSMVPSMIASVIILMDYFE